MRFELEPSQDLGLQHVLENGLRVVGGGTLGAERDAEILDDLREMVSEADRGSDAVRAESLTFSPSETSAVERFSLFYRYLKYAPDVLTESLASAKDVLEKLSRHEVVSDAEQSALTRLFSDLLESLKREQALTPLPTPRDLHFH